LARSRSVSLSFFFFHAIAGGQLLTAVIAHQRLGFESFTEEVEDVLKDHKQQQKVCTTTFRFPSSLFDLTLSPKGPGEEGVKVGAVRKDRRRAMGGTAKTVCRE
jgi:hypothetical protein